MLTSDWRLCGSLETAGRNAPLGITKINMSTQATTSKTEDSLRQDHVEFCHSQVVSDSFPPGFQDMLGFGLIEALVGRRARRFFMGAEIPDGVLAFKSRHKPLPLSELEKLLVVTACGGNTGWHHMIYRAKLYAPHLSNYSAAAGGRTFPSAAGFHTSKTFFTDDEGVYLLDNRDSPACVDRAPDGSFSFDAAVEALKKRIRKVREGRLSVPPTVPYVEPHNTWVVNHPGTLLVIPVADLAQHVLLNLCYFLQNGSVICDDVTVAGSQASKSSKTSSMSKTHGR
jgi:hypothetical protein